MSDYNNPRPLPTASASDPCTIVDNAISFDKVINGDSTVTTYTGKQILSLSQAIDKFGFGVAPFTFTTGGTLESKNLLVSNDPVDGFLYKYIGNGAFPLTVPATTDPTIGGSWQQFASTNANLITTSGDGSVQDFIDKNTFANVAAMKSFTNHIIGSKVQWLGYYSESDGGGNWGTVKSGVHTEDGGFIFSINENTYIEANLKGRSINAAKFGIKPYALDPTYDNSIILNKISAYIQNTRTTDLPSSPTLALKSIPKIVIPDGAYNIETTINLPRTCVVEGNETIIYSDVNGLLMFKTDPYGYRIKFKGITFDGVDAQAFTIVGENLDNAKFQFDDCVLLTRTETAGKYAIDIFSQSSVVYFKKTDVFNAPNFLKVKADMTRINGGWINGFGAGEIKPANSASIDSDTQMRIYGTTFIPELDGSGTRANVRWINLRGKDIVCDSCNFGGENGGFDIIYSYVDARNNSFPYNAEGAVRVINSQVACRNAIVTLVGAVATPSKYDFRSNTFTINRYGVSSQGLDFTKTIAETDALLSIRMIDQSSERYRRTVPEVTYSGVDKSPLYFPECLNSYVNRVHGVVGGQIRNLEAGAGNAVRILQIIKEAATSGHFSGFIGKLRVVNQNLDVQQIKQYTIYVSWSPAAGIADVDIVQDSFNQNTAGSSGGWADRFAVTAANLTANSVDFLLTNTDTFAQWAFAYRLEGFTTQNNDTTGGFPIALTGATEQR